MRRRDFIAALSGAAAAWPLAARAQLRPMPVIGFLHGASAAGYAAMVAAFRQGLKETGYVEGENVTIEFRWADGHYDQLPALANDLVHRQVAMIAAGATPAALAAKTATATIPVVFTTNVDPVERGLVASLNRPGGNVTGITTLGVELGPKQLELLHELVPTATDVGLLVNPANPTVTERTLKDVEAAARTLGLKLQVVRASSDREIDMVFASLSERRIGALQIGGETFFVSRSKQLALLSLRHAIPTVFEYREFTAAGGLMSYSGSLTDQYRQVGIYAGRILKGEKPGDLPVQQTTKAELIINLKTAKALGLEVPMSMLMRVDEVIE